MDDVVELSTAAIAAVAAICTGALGVVAWIGERSTTTRRRRHVRTLQELIPPEGSPARSLHQKALAEARIDLAIWERTRPATRATDVWGMVASLSTATLGVTAGFTMSASFLTGNLASDMPLFLLIAIVLLPGVTLTAALSAHEVLSRQARGEMRRALLSDRLADEELIKDPREHWTAAVRDFRTMSTTPVGRSVRLGLGQTAAILLASGAIGVLATIPIAPPDGTSPLSDPRIVAVTALFIAATSLTLVTSYHRRVQFPEPRASWPTAEELTPDQRNTTPD